MTFIRTALTLTTLAAALTFGLAPVIKAQQTPQISEERLRELIREAERAAQETRLPTTIQTPQAGPVRPLTLDEAVELTLQNNIDIKVQRINPQLQDVSVASARTFWAPSLSSTIQQQSTQSPSTSQLNQAAGGAGVLSRNTTYNATITQNMPWGGGVFSGQLNNNRQSTNSNNATFNPSYNSTWTAQYTQPLLRDFKIDAQRRSLTVSRISRDISDIQLRASITNTVSNVRNAYWDYVFAVQGVEAAQQSLTLATRLVEDNRIRVEVGTMAPIDITQAEAEQASRNQGLITAENTRATSEIALKRLIVSGAGDPLWNARLDPTDRPEFRPEPIDIEAATRRAISERTDLEIARRNIEQNQLTIGYLRNQALPIMDLSATYGLSGVGGTRLVRSQSGVIGSQVTTVIPGGVSDALSSIFRNENPRWTVGVNITYPLGFTSQEASVARARLQLSQVGLQIQQMELQIATDIQNAAINLRNTAAAVEAARASLALSQRRLEAEQSKFEVGMSTNYNVVQAQRDLNDVQNSELRAILNYRRALVEWERLQQTAIGGAGITVIN